MYYYIANPTAGQGALRNVQTKLRARLDQLGITGQWVTTTAPGEAATLAQKAIASGHTTIIAVGGDGTVNEVINGLATYESPHDAPGMEAPNSIAIGVIPIGTSNRLAQQLDITTWSQACDLLAARRLTTYSLIAAGQHYFLSTLTVGLETELDKRLETQPRPNLRGQTSQFLASWRHARTYTPLSCHIQVDSQYQLQCDLFSLSIANQKFLNPLAPEKLIVSLTDRPGHLQLGTFIWQTLRDRSVSPVEDTPTTRFLANNIVIKTTPTAGIMIDGAVATRTPIAVRLTDRHVRFITNKT